MKNNQILLQDHADDIDFLNGFINKEANAKRFIVDDRDSYYSNSQLASDFKPEELDVYVNHVEDLDLEVRINKKDNKLVVETCIVTWNDSPAYFKAMDDYLSRGPFKSELTYQYDENGNMFCRIMAEIDPSNAYLVEIEALHRIGSLVMRELEDLAEKVAN